jgi:HD-GYP domain-containing protein (c-di-GMP phosphodiesterase class II)/HAMP domain-containing protein
VKLGPLHTERRFLRSRVARRVFAGFVLCALFPIAVLAVFSFTQLSSRLEEDARARLRSDAKQDGMALLERLLMLDAALRMADAELEALHSRNLGDLPEGVREALVARFSGLRLEEARRGVGRAGDDASRSGLAAAERLAGGGTALALEPAGPDEPARVVLLREVGERGRGLVLRGEADPRFLWPADAERPGVSLEVREEGSGLLVAQSLREGSRTANDAALQEAWNLFLMPHFGAASWRVELREPTSSALGPLYSFGALFPRVALLSLCVVGLLSIGQIRRSLDPIELLGDATRRLGEGDLAARVEIASGDEFQELGRSFNAMAAAIERQVDVLRTMNAIGSALSEEPDPRRILDAILRGAQRVTGADGAAIHRVTSDERLQLALLRVESLGLVAPASGEERDLLAARALPALPLARTVITSGQTAQLSDLEQASPEDAEAQRSFDARLGYRTRSLLAIPMFDHDGQVIGALQLLNRRGPGDEPTAFSAEDRVLAESLASQAGVVLSKHGLLHEFRLLFEGLVDLLVQAIDEKSPYTGQHCRRVPILTEMIADAAARSEIGALRLFRPSEPERYELRIAALLHDCGKVTTPVHVIDKATKLETLFDRIELLATRFEALKREAEVRSLERRLAAAGLPAELDERAQGEMRRLDQDLATLRRCNVGVEQMAAADQAEVRAIASRWSWHAPDGTLQPALSDDEVANLTVTRGTLTPQEREVIHHHVVATVRMLERLPYPRHLRGVPAIAGAHHERLDGSGYPLGLDAARISLQGRILGLADVFEALTAKDRPYKRALKLSEVVAILRDMADDGKIDRDLLEVFLRERLHLRYAREYLDPEQLDEEALAEVQSLPD